MNDPAITAASKDTGTVRTIYILYLVGLVIGITALVGVIMAYINRKDADRVAQSHYQFQIRTFWIGLLMMVVGAMTSALIVGLILVLFWCVWCIVRCVKGMKYNDNHQAVPKPESWGFGD